MATGRIALVRPLFIIFFVFTTGCSPIESPAPSIAVPDETKVVLRMTGLSSISAVSLVIEPSVVRGPVTGAVLEGINVSLSNRSSSGVEFTQVLTLFQVEGERIIQVICEFGSGAPEIEPRLCDIERPTWFPLASGQSVGNDSPVPLFLPFVGTNLVFGTYIVAAPIMDSSGGLRLATAKLSVVD